jgi:hypothetical protein
MEKRIVLQSQMYEELEGELTMLSEGILRIKSEKYEKISELEAKLSELASLIEGGHPGE